MSKSIKGNCNHKYIQGSKKGTICNNPCIGDKCRTHKKSTIDKKKEYRESKKKIIPKSDDTCKYIFIKSYKKGSICGNPCRGDRCSYHKPKTIERKKDYYKEQREKEKNKGNSNSVQESLKLRILYDEAKLLIKKLKNHSLLIEKEKDNINKNKKNEKYLDELLEERDKLKNKIDKQKGIIKKLV